MSRELWEKALKDTTRVRAFKIIEIEHNLTEEQKEAIWGLWRELNKPVKQQALDPEWWGRP